MTLLDHALAYAEQGVPVFPIKVYLPEGETKTNKVPLTPHGFHDASTDPDQIREWFSDPRANGIGYPTGEAPWHFVDCDGLEGANAFEEWNSEVGGRAIPSGPTIITPSNGYHLLIEPIEGARNRAGMLPQVDYRGGGGFGVLPPSYGGAYQWVEPLDVKALRPAPEPLKELVLNKRSNAPAPRPIKDRLLARSAAATGGAGGYGETALAREIETLSRATSGQRNHALNAAAFPLYQLADAGVLDVATVEFELTATARDLGLGEFEIARTLQSAAAGAAANPRRASRLPSERAEIVPIRTPAPQVAPPDEEIADPDDAYSAFRAKFQTTDQLLATPPPEPLIAGVLNKGGFAALYGHPGSLKSFVAIDWALCIAKGKWWNGRAVEKGSVVYVIAEGHAGAGPRVKAWQEHHGLTERVDGLTWYPEAGGLLDGGWVANMGRYCAEVQPTLVVIDTLSRSMPGGDENDSKDMTQAIRNIEHIQREGGGCAVLLIHHSPKTGGTLRGHSSLHGAVDTAIETRKEEGFVVLSNPKQKDAESFPDITLWWKQSAESIVLTPDAVEKEGPDWTELRASDVLEALRKHYRLTGATSSVICETLNMTSAEVMSAVNRLLEQGRVTQEGARFRAR